MRCDPQALAHNAITIPPPHYTAFENMGGVRALHFTAMRAPHLKGFDCALGNPQKRAANKANRALAALSFGIAEDRLLTTRQSENTVFIVARGWNIGMRPGAHAVVMARNYTHVIGVLVNDCAPVLMADTENQVVAAVHLGWREAARNMLERTIDAMACLGAKRQSIAASIGPCAGVERTYEVSKDFAGQSPNQDREIADFLTLHEGKTYFSFQDYVAHRLQRCGLAESNISRIAVDTIIDEKSYSYRREGQGQGSMLSAIRLMGPN